MTTSDATSERQGSAFGQWLKGRRNALGLTREELAGRVDCSPETIYKIETGTRRPSRQVAEILAGFFQVPSNERKAFIEFARGQGAGSEGRGTARREHPWREVHRRLTNLPSQVTSLIGREEEVEEARALLLRENVRLLTLIGPPGIGKTRMALEVAARLSDYFEEGVFFVPLAPITDPELVAAAIAKVLGVKEAANQPALDTLTQHLRDKRVLLVLDNFEQIIEAGPQVAQLLAECPWVKVLVTSREALHVYGERLYPVPPLRVPGTTESPGTVPSVALFVERAQAVKPDFALTEENAQAIGAICVRLDGLPLAIELAAARIRLFTPRAMLQMLEHSLRLLTVGARDLPLRHQTLRDAIEWSYNLLDEGDQRLLRRLGVFVGGCTLLAIEAVCNSKGDIPGGGARAAESLLDKSLLQQSEGSVGESRFFMLETIREYASEQLAEGSSSRGGEGDTIRRLHGEYYLAIAEAAELEWRGPRQGEWSDHLERERYNLRAALQWARESGEIGMALRMSAALYPYWFQRGYVNEGRSELEATISLSEGLETADRAKVLYGVGRLAIVQNDYVAARNYYLQSLETARKLGDVAAGKQALSDALRALSQVSNRMGNLAMARQYSEEQLAAARELGDERGIAAALSSLGGVALDESDYELARRYYEEGVEISRRIQDQGRIAAAHVNLGLVAYAQGDYAMARSLQEEALAIFRERGAKVGIATALENLADIARSEGKYGEAIANYAETIALCRELGNKGVIAGCLASLAAVWRGRGDWGRAARLLGAAESIRSALGYQFLPADRIEHEKGLAALRDALGADAFDKAWAEGQAMPFEEAVALALAGSESG